ncbi:DUF4192 domain-containing protein [Corynebacterium aquatimens]
MDMRRKFTETTRPIDFLTGPADLIASLPGILGFYPTESVVIVGLEENPRAPGAYLVGPVMRADLVHASSATSAVTKLGAKNCTAFYGFVITRIPNSDLARDAMQELEDLRINGRAVIDACWHLSEVATGTPYTILFESLGHEHTLIDGWSNGVVASIVSSPTMKPFLKEGALPAADREEALSYFEPHTLDSETRRDVDQLSKLANRHAGILWERIEGRRAGARGAIDDACAILTRGEAHPVIAPDEEFYLGDVFEQESEVVLIAALLSTPGLRDCLIAPCLKNPETAAGVLLSIGRTFSGTIRANALTIWAMIAFARGLNSWAIAALTTVQDEEPTHSMSAIMLQILSVSNAQDMIDVIVQTCEEFFNSVVEQHPAPK